MTRTKKSKPGGGSRRTKDGVSIPPPVKRKANDAGLDESPNGSPAKRNASVEDVLQNGGGSVTGPDALVISKDPMHPANHICELCRKFYDHGWVTGTGGGVSIKHGKHIFIAPSGVQKELMRPTDMFVMDFETQAYLRRPAALKPSACTPLFMASFTKRNAGCCIHTHSQWAVLITLIVESGAQSSPASATETIKDIFSINQIEQIKGISRGGSGSDEIAEGGRKLGNLGFYDTMHIPIIENTAHEEDLKDTLEKAIEEWPETCAVLVKRHGVYVWGKDVAQAKTQCESLDYLFQLAVEMQRLGLKWVR